MPRLYNTAVRDTAGALRHQGIGPTEIAERLNAGTAGLEHPVSISARRVRDYIRDYCDIHGPPPKLGQAAQSIDSIDRLRDRAVAVVAKVIEELERKAPAKMTTGDLARLRSALKTFNQLENRGPARKAAASGADKPQRSPLEELAADLRAAQHQSPIDGRQGETHRAMDTSGVGERRDA